MKSMLRVICFTVAVSVSRIAFAQADPPSTPKRPVTDQYHGVKVTDDYRWLEDWSNPETRAWGDSENAHARRYLDALPGREHLREQIKAILSTPSANFESLRRGGGTLFALRFQPPKEQSFLVTSCGRRYSISRDSLHHRLQASGTSKPVLLYCVLSNQTLRNVAVTKPAADPDLLAIPGIGPTIVRTYGAEILKIVKTASSHASVPEKQDGVAS